MTAFSLIMSNRHQSIHDGEEYLSAQKIMRQPLPSGAPLFDVFVGDLHAMPERRSSHIVNHEYTDHASEVQNGKTGQGSRGGVATPFVVKLHEMIDAIERDGHGDIVSWQPHGRCFVVHKQKEFTDHVMPTYFKMSKFPSFLRQLNLYGFRRLTRVGTDKGGYYHELFLRNKVFLAYRILRMRIKGNGVRARSNPESEPNFYKMPSVEEGNAKSGVTVKSEPAKVLPLLTLSSEKGASLIAETLPDGLELDLKDFDFAGKMFQGVEEVSETTKTPALEADTLSQDEMGAFLQRLSITPREYDDIVKNLGNDKDYGNMIERLVGAC
jgi:hypothetical protein